MLAGAAAQRRCGRPRSGPEHSDSLWTAAHVAPPTSNNAVPCEPPPLLQTVPTLNSEDERLGSLLSRSRLQLLLYLDYRGVRVCVRLSVEFI